MDFIETIFRNPTYFRIIKNTLLGEISKINDNDLDDCISEVYLALVQKKASLEKHPNIRGWLYLTSKNIAKRFIEDQFIKGINSTELTVDLVAAINLEETYEDEERGEEIMEILSKSLTLSEYRLFESKFLKNKSNQEIAALMGIKKTSVEVKTTRLREKIKNILKNM